jgi:hypothetical protein
LAIRRIVERVPAKGAVEKAAELCRSWNTLYGNNFMVATPEPGGGLPAGVLEYDSQEGRDGGVTLRGPDKASDGKPREWVVCTNHHRARGSSFCGRYNSLAKGCADSSEKFDLEALIQLVDAAAVPAATVLPKNAYIATLHQAVARTAERRLWIRMILEPSKNIRDVTGTDLDVTALLSAKHFAARPAASVGASH